MEDKKKKLYKKWNYLKNFELIKTLIYNNNDLLIFGQVNCGKTELIKDLLDNKTYKIDISLLINKNINNILNKISFKISTYFDFDWKQTEKQRDLKEIHWIKFLNYKRSIDNNENKQKNIGLKIHLNKICVVFEDTQYFNLGSEKQNFLLNKLYSNLKSFRNTLKINIQYIFISRRFLNLNLGKIFIEYPKPEDFIKLFFEEIYKIFFKNKLDLEENIIIKFLNKIIYNYELLIKNYQTLKLICCIYSDLFIKIIKNSNMLKKNEKEFKELFFKLFTSKEIKILQSLLWYDPNWAYKPQSFIFKTINELKDKIKDNSNISFENIKEFLLEKKQDKLPLIPSLILISLFLASKTTNLDDNNVYKDYSKKLKKKKAKKTKKIKKIDPSSKISLNRLIAIFQIILENYLKNNNKIENSESINKFESNEFFSSIWFLENIRLINKSNQISDETSRLKLEYIGSKELIEFLSKEYDIELLSYLNEFN